MVTQRLHNKRVLTSFNCAFDYILQMKVQDSQRDIRNATFVNDRWPPDSCRISWDSQTCKNQSFGRQKREAMTLTMRINSMYTYFSLWHSQHKLHDGQRRLNPHTGACARAQTAHYTHAAHTTRAGVTHAHHTHARSKDSRTDSHMRTHMQTQTHVFKHRPSRASSHRRVRAQLTHTIRPTSSINRVINRNRTRRR